MGTDALQFVVVAVHAEGMDAHALDGFRNGVTEVVKRVEQRIKEKHPTVDFRCRFLNSEEAGGILDWQSACTVAVLDVSEIDEKLTLCAGRLQGAGVPLIFVGGMGSESVVKRLHRGISDIVLYHSTNEFFQTNSAFETELFRAVPETRIQEELIFRFWFPRGTSTIWIVCPQDHDPSPYADRSDPDYTYLDNLGDQDALLELIVFLSRHYPNTTIRHFHSGDLPDGQVSGNLVVLGGPGSNDIGNSVCAEMMAGMNSRVSYSEDCEQVTIRTGQNRAVELRAEYHSGTSSGAAAHRRIRKDVGYFARFPNLLDRESAVVLVNGIHTTGVLGAARAFSDRPDALPNFHTVLKTGAGSSGFECYFKVPVLSGDVRVPSVEIEQVFSVSPKVIDIPSSQERPTSESATQNSAKILFIAGDRSGPQQDQLQTSEEYDAIEEVLRASEYRESIFLELPILAATRQKLAHAYEKRPQIVHFAGHGYDRILSIIEKYNGSAYETPLSAEELREILATMKGEVVLCVLNACQSEELAHDLANSEVVEYAVGWPSKVSDSTAITFSRSLYRALGNGQEMCAAFKSAKIACGQREMPVLIPRKNAANKPFVGARENGR